MIYTKATNFSYPILNNIQDDYIDGYFNIGIQTDYKDGKNYQFNIDVDLGSDFLMKLIENNQARLYLIVSSVTSNYYEFSLDDPLVKIPESRVYLKDNTRFQVIIMSTSTVSFAENKDLHKFYDDFKEEIVIEAGKLLAFSNHYTFSGDIEKATNLFKQKTDSDLEIPVEITFDRENIIIKYKDSKAKFSGLNDSRNLNNMYLYAGLQKVLLNIISKYYGDTQDTNYNSLEDGILVERINEGDPLDMKMKDLLLDKNIERIYLDNIDFIIQTIAEGIVDKYIKAIEANHD